ncbi:MAG: N-acetylmuramoyl-L-alanine amidase [Phycisphaerae bacterium]
MTLGTALLSWVHDLTPAKSSATTLMGTTARRIWDKIIVETISTRALAADGSVRGFYHLHIDRTGRVHESRAWLREQHDSADRGAIRLVVSVDRDSPDLTPRQWKCLSEVVAHLQSVHQISRDRIEVHESQPVPGRLGAMLRTR